MGHGNSAMTDRELAVAVARAVGCEPTEYSGGRWGCPCKDTGHAFNDTGYFDYPTDLNAAWEAAKTLGDVHIGTDGGGVTAEITGGWYVQESAPTAARALCLAIVKAAENG